MKTKLFALVDILREIPREIRRCLALWCGTCAIFLSGCTTLNDPTTGKRLLFTTANADLFEYSGAGVSLRVVNLKHESASAIIGAGGAAATAMGLGVGGL